MSAQTDSLVRWETPGSYFGPNPVGDIIVATQHRDSSLLDQSNFETARKRVADVLGEGPSEVQELRDGGYAMGVFYILGTRHWAVGWVDYLMLRADAPVASIEEARAIAADLESYPVLDETDYSEREWNAAAETWKHASLRERIDYCAEDGCSIFAARHDEIPDTGSGEIIGRLSGEIR